jgi:hypothetical protein
MPENENEVVLIIGKDLQISDFVLYMLGIRDSQELRNYILSISDDDPTNDEVIESTHYTFEEILNYEFKVLPDSDRYKVVDGKIVETTSGEIDTILSSDKAVTLKVVGIVTPIEDNAMSSIGSIGYLEGLMDTMIDKSKDSAVITLQQANTTTNLYNGFPFAGFDFDISSIQAMINANPMFKDYASFFSSEEKFIDVLKTFYQGSNYLFVGDKNQMVFNGTGNFVEDIKTIVLKRPLRVYTLDTNYRSTIEISDYSVRYLTDNSTVTSVRNGTDVIEETKLTGDVCREAVIEHIRKMVDNGFTSVTLLCNTLKEAQRIRNMLRLPLAIENKITFKALPVYLAKGLEYDCVITYNVSDDLMYTACTRAMHQLVVLKDCSL